MATGYPSTQGDPPLPEDYTYVYQACSILVVRVESLERLNTGVQYSTHDRVESVEDLTSVYSTVHIIKSKGSKEETRCRNIQYIYLHECCYMF